MLCVKLAQSRVITVAAVDLYLSCVKCGRRQLTETVNEEISLSISCWRQSKWSRWKKEKRIEGFFHAHAPTIRFFHSICYQRRKLISMFRGRSLLLSVDVKYWSFSFKDSNGWNKKKTNCKRIQARTTNSWAALKENFVMKSSMKSLCLCSDKLSAAPLCVHLNDKLLIGKFSPALSNERRKFSNKT